MGVQIEVQREKGYLCTFEKCGPSSANWVKWEVASKPMKNVTLGVKFISP
jgi:hypothetical protein